MGRRMGIKRESHDMNKIEPSQNYKTFYQYVFGDSRYYHYNGLPENVFTSLDRAERIEVEKLVLKAIRKIFIDERVIRAAGYLKLQAAIPVLEKRLAISNILISKKVRSSMIWTLLKIKGDKQQLGKIIDIVNGSKGSNDLTQADAVDLISDFGKEPPVIDALLHAFLEKDLSVSASARNALVKIFKDDQYISGLFKSYGFSSTLYIRDSIIEHIKLSI